MLWGESLVILFCQPFVFIQRDKILVGIKSDHVKVFRKPLIEIVNYTISANRLQKLMGLIFLCKVNRVGCNLYLHAYFYRPAVLTDNLKVNKFLVACLFWKVLEAECLFLIDGFLILILQWQDFIFWLVNDILNFMKNIWNFKFWFLVFYLVQNILPLQF